MRSLFKLLFFTLIIFGLANCKQPTTAKDVDGNTIDFSQLRGNWVVINYWASWCQPCYREMPELNAFFNKNKTNNVTVLGVNYDYTSNSEELLEIIQRMGVEFPTLTSDPAGELGINEIPGLPSTYIFDPNGRLIAELKGEQTQQDLESIIYPS